MTLYATLPLALRILLRYSTAGSLRNWGILDCISENIIKLLEDVLCKIDHLENAVAAIDTRGQTVSLVSFWEHQCNQERLQFQSDPNWADKYTSA